MTQKILFPMEYMNITTGINEASHVGSNAIDCAGSDAGIDYVNAPFKGVIKKIYPFGHTVWLESLEPVEFADGTIDYATASFTHDNIVTDLSVGQVVQQWQIFYQEGTAGNATGNHIHLEIGRGRFTGTGWYQNANGNWVINNSYIPYNAFFLRDTIVINGRNYPWKKETNNVAIIQNADNWFGRCDKTMYQMRGRNIGRAEFEKYAVGAEFLNWVEAVSDNAEADTATNWQNLGRLAATDNWQKQIYDGQAKAASLELERNKARDEAAAKQTTINSQDVTIKDLQAKLATTGEDTTNLNVLGVALQWILKRLGLKG
jgi:hypothetical protein